MRDAMLSECARTTTSAENRYRISAPNSRPRAVTVVALDSGSEDIVVRLATQRWGDTVFRTAAAANARRADARIGCLHDLTGRPVDLDAEIGRAHLVVLIATVGADVSAAVLIGKLCRRRGVTMTTLVLTDSLPQHEARSMTLARLRSVSTMLVTTSSSEYFVDMLAALRA